MGVGIILGHIAQKALIEYAPINDRLITSQIRIATGHLTVHQVYAPTTDASEEAVDEFYANL